MKNKSVSGLAIMLLTGLVIISCPNGKELHEGYFTKSPNSVICALDNKTGHYEENFGKSWAAWEVARKHFYSSHNKWTDDFGGVYIDGNGIVNILVVGSRRPVISNYLIYRQVLNSYNFLERVLNEISDIMTEFTIWQAGICEIHNKILVCLEYEREIHSLISHLKTKNLFKQNTLKIFVEKREWNLGYTKRYNSSIMYRENVELHEEASISEEFWINNYHLLENLFDRLRDRPDPSGYFSNIIIFESKEEAQGITIEGLNIDGEYFYNHLLGMIIVPWGGGQQLRNAKVYNGNDYLAFSVDIWVWSGISTDDLRWDIFFLNIPK